MFARTRPLFQPRFSIRAHPTRRLPPRAPGAARPADIVTEGFRARPLAWLRCVWTRIDRSRSFGLAAEMAFWVFLSLLPLAAVAGLAAAKLATGSWSTAAPLLQSLPLATRELIRTELGRVAAWNGGKVGVTAGLVFIWLASSGVHSIFDGIELESEAGPRPWWMKRLLAIGACVALSVGVALLALLGTGLGWLWHLVGGATLLRALELESSSVGQIFRLFMGTAVAFGLVCGLYAIALPPGARRVTPVAPGAAVAIGLQIALGLGYGFYITQAGDGGAYQAGLASIGVTLMALYLFCLALLVGTRVNEMLGERRRALLSPGG
jgi:membrane protein